ncbi:hypothetical protein Pla22_09990 [Rubripirellula amarantea]|uniref:Uncharacterized protein n=1 Tax=Rubripirellula amarantea TaxID=2527999 RepID=A0A5C5WSA2_9BACT|nr:hypothetical protein Pla22_09990 [Rubripirellula amarantea]
MEGPAHHSRATGAWGKYLTDRRTYLLVANEFAFEFIANPIEHPPHTMIEFRARSGASLTGRSRDTGVTRRTELLSGAAHSE